MKCNRIYGVSGNYAQLTNSHFNEPNICNPIYSIVFCAMVCIFPSHKAQRGNQLYISIERFSSVHLIKSLFNSLHTHNALHTFYTALISHLSWLHGLRLIVNKRAIVLLHGVSSGVVSVAQMTRLYLIRGAYRICIGALRKRTCSYILHSTQNRLGRENHKGLMHCTMILWPFLFRGYILTFPSEMCVAILQREHKFFGWHSMHSSVQVLIVCIVVWPMQESKSNNQKLSLVHCCFNLFHKRRHF